MRSAKSVMIVSAILCCLSMPVFAAKRVYKARVLANNELHQVSGSSAGGSALIRTAINGTGIEFQVFVRGLSGDATAVYLHGPGDESEVAPAVVKLCDSTAPAVFVPCPGRVQDVNGNLNLDFSGSIPGNLLIGMNGATFTNHLNNGLIYINVYTALNPLGEARGQFEQVFP